MKRRFPDTDLYCITASELSLGRSNVEVVRQMLAAGVTVVQYREKKLTMRQKYRECLELRQLCASSGALFIVNDDVALALAVAADGVHVGQDDLPAEKVREIVGDRMLVGLSISTPRQADEAAQSRAIDYVGAGPVFETATKEDSGAAVGLAYLDYVVRHCPLPVVAIGGIRESNVADVVRHGVTSVAMISEIVGATDIGGKIRSVQQTMSRAKPS